MKKTITTSILVAVLGFTAITANAKSWRINSNVTQKADFSDINAAMSSDKVAAGDTLYLDPGCLLTAKQTVSKRVTIVGPGYLRGNAPHQGATISGVLYLSAANAKIEGVTMTNEVHIRAQYVTIERCRATKPIHLTTDVNAQYATIRQCYAYRISGYVNTSTSSAYWTIENNIILQTTNYYNPIENLNNPTIRNNYILYNYNGTGYYSIAGIQGGIITNNIIFNKKTNNNVWSNVTDAVITRNVTSSAEKTDYPDNIYLAHSDESLVFKMEGTYDQKYQLKDDSPAKGYATDGGDCGHTGGTYPYVLNGLPAGYPYYSKANIAPRAKNGKINVSLNIKMQNE
jgi:hypothetical protein